MKYVQDIRHTEVLARRGAKISTLVRYVLMSTLPHETVVLHVGTNSVRSPTFLTDYEDLISVVRQRSCFSNVGIVISSILPRPRDNEKMISVGGVRWTVKNRVVHLNQELKCLAKRTPNCQFATTYKMFLVSPTRPKMGLFAVDKLHLNDRGTARLITYFRGFIKNCHGVMFNPINV